MTSVWTDEPGVGRCGAAWCGAGEGEGAEERVGVGASGRAQKTLEKRLGGLKKAHNNSDRV